MQRLVMNDGFRAKSDMASSRLAPSRLAPSRLAPSRLAPSRLAPSPKSSKRTSAGPLPCVEGCVGAAVGISYKVARGDYLPMVQEQIRIGRRLSAILAADVAGYSRLMGLDEAGTARTLREHRVVSDALVATHGGRIVKTTGDGL